MAALTQTVTVTVDAGELIPTLQWETYRRDISPAGALHIGDGFGVVGLKVGDRRVLSLRVHEDKLKHVVIDVIDELTGEKLGTIDPELYGLVTPRRA